MFFRKDGRATGEELAKLVAPLTPAAFFEDYWAKRSVCIRGKKDKFKGFFDEAAFWRALTTIDGQGLSSIGLIRAHWDDRDRPPDATHLFMRVNAQEARRDLERGATLCVNCISEGDTRLKAFAGAMKKQLGWPGLARFNAYWSPKDRGLAMHFDARVTCSMQIAGKKTWWFSRLPAVEWPRGNADRVEGGAADYIDAWVGGEAWEQARPTDAGDFEQVTLEPGDTLILPPGAWHSASAAGEESLALNLAMDGVSPLALLVDVLEKELRSDVTWRMSPPLASGAGGAKFLRERAKLLRRALEKIAADEKRLSHAWNSRVNEPI